MRRHSRQPSESDVQGIPESGPDEVYILATRDGSDTLYHTRLGVTYHSAYGAVSESRHIFLQHGLHTMFHLPSVAVLEIGFGTGLNAFLAYLFSIRYEREVRYTGIEPFPVRASVAARLDYAGYLAFPEEREIFLRMHEKETFDYDRFHFKRHTSLQQLDAQESFDCIFFDPFAPAIQPELWQEDKFARLYELLSPGGCLVTYSAQGQVRRDMTKAGFKVERLPGPPGKREMLRGVRAG